MDLIAPESYLLASPAERAAVVNGCGPAGWRFDLVPDSLAGLDVSEACKIHDWMYRLGGDEAARKEADVILYLNLARLVLMAGGSLTGIRMAGAAAFYLAVRKGGAAYFALKD
jgi:hypothetical protein